MKARIVTDRVHWVGALDPQRPIFDALIPTPRGTSYNAWLVRGSEKVALVDTVEPDFLHVLQARLDSLGLAPDYIISNHAEQDHSGSIPAILRRYPEARLVTSPKGHKVLDAHLELAPDRVLEVADGDTISLGDRSLRFIHAPWVHWPETMLTWMPEEKVLFPCDLFGSHVGSHELLASGVEDVMLEARRYFATIMMPFSQAIRKHLDRLEGLDVALVAPSHGPVWDEPRRIMEAYRRWVSGTPSPKVVIAYVSMHGSTAIMVEDLAEMLLEAGVPVRVFDLDGADLGLLAAELVDASALVLGTPTVLGGPHPLAVHAAWIVNALRPRLKKVGLVGSFGWGGKTVEQVTGLLGALKAEVLPPIMVKGLPGADTHAALAELVEGLTAG